MTEYLDLVASRQLGDTDPDELAAWTAAVQDLIGDDTRIRIRPVRGNEKPGVYRAVNGVPVGESLPDGNLTDGDVRALRALRAAWEATCS